MKTFQQFCEDAASEFRSGQLAYQSSPAARLASRKDDAADRSRTAASDFRERSLAKAKAQKQSATSARERISAVQQATLEKKQEEAQRRAAAVAARRKAQQSAEDRQRLKDEIKAELTKEAYDKDIVGASQITKQGEGGRIGRDRRTGAETVRTRAAGGGKTVPAKRYKSRKDIGKQRTASERQQQPEQERGSAREAQLAAAKEERRRAAQARIAAKKKGEAPATAKPKAKEVAKTASQLLSKKGEKKPVSPAYKPTKASGLTTQERKALYKKGERTLRDLVLQATGKKSEKELKHKITSK